MGYCMPVMNFNFIQPMPSFGCNFMPQMPIFPTFFGMFNPMQFSMQSFMQNPWASMGWTPSASSMSTALPFQSINQMPMPNMSMFNTPANIFSMQPNNYFNSCNFNNIFGNKISTNNSVNKSEKVDTSAQSVSGDAKHMYEAMGLDKLGLNFKVFEKAIQGYNKLSEKEKATGKLGIFDTTQSSDKERYYLIDLNTKTVIGRSVVKTGSGNMNNVKAANNSGSHATLSGFMKVGSEYYSTGKQRYSMYLDGLEAGINNNARSKSVVVHHVKPGQEHTWGCMGFSPELTANGSVDVEATRAKMKKLFPEGCITFTYPTDEAYWSTSKLYA